MSCKLTKTSRTIRVIIGLAILGAGLYFRSWWGLLGIIPLVVAARNYCPIEARMRKKAGGTT